MKGIEVRQEQDTSLHLLRGSAGRWGGSLSRNRRFRAPTPAVWGAICYRPGCCLWMASPEAVRAPCRTRSGQPRTQPTLDLLPAMAPTLVLPVGPPASRVTASVGSPILHWLLAVVANGAVVNSAWGRLNEALSLKYPRSAMISPESVKATSYRQMQTLLPSFCRGRTSLGGWHTAACWARQQNVGTRHSMLIWSSEFLVKAFQSLH